MEAERIFTRWWILIFIPEDNLRGIEEVQKQQGRKNQNQRRRRTRPSEDEGTRASTDVKKK
jgi:hypothetical protein